MNDFTAADLPYADDDLANGYYLLDARRHETALANNPTKIRFLIHDYRVYERTFTVAELDQCAPGWREALARPADHDLPGRFDLDDAAVDDLDSNEEVETLGHTRIELVPTDRTPTHLQLRRTFADGTTATETVTVEADDLDDVSWGWREAIGADDTTLRGLWWTLDRVARLAEQYRTPAADEDPHPATSVDLLAITQ